MRDGVQDVCYEAVFNYPGGRLTGFELEINGSIKRVFNTNPVDIYPLVGFIKDGEFLNKKDGSLDISLAMRPKDSVSVSTAPIPLRKKRELHINIS